MSEHGPLKARMYIGGLKSLFIELAETLDEVEKTGQMPVDMLQSLIDIKTAIDITLVQLSKVSVRCCEHAPECEHNENEDDDEDEEDDTCDGDCHGCDCHEEEEEEPPPPPKKHPAKKPSAKKVDDKIVIPAKKTKH